MRYICDESGNKEDIVISIEELNEKYIRKRYYKFERARGYWDEGEFVLCEKSKISRGIVPSLNTQNREVREKYINQGLIDDNYTLTENIKIGTWSRAASIVAGGQRSGPESWTPIR